MCDDDSAAGVETSTPSLWLLLAEDDALFASLFNRFFRARYPNLELVTARSVGTARESLQARGNPPVFAVLDLNLEDGSARDLEPDLTCAYLIWSASPEGALQAKPNGREALQAAVREIGNLAGLESPDLPSNRGSSMGEKE